MFSLTQCLLISVPGYPGCISEIQYGLRFLQTLKNLLEIISVLSLSYIQTHTQTWLVKRAVIRLGLLTVCWERFWAFA